MRIAYPSLQLVGLRSFVRAKPLFNLEPAASSLVSGNGKRAKSGVANVSFFQILDRKFTDRSSKGSQVEL